MGDIVCISHLRWDFVWQRPQHILSRLAKEGRVLFVEEPVTDINAKEPHLEIVPARHAPGVKIIKLHQPAQEHYWIGHGDPQTQEAYNRLLLDYLQTEGFSNPTLWMYTPMGLEFVDRTEHSLLVYDVMDQLAAFKGAPPNLLKNEETLLRRADVVFTGGASLYRAKLPYNENTHLFPSGVEIEHFAQAASPQDLEVPADIAAIQKPVLGYYGVIDERMDLPLLEHLAQSHPEWNLVILGPVIKISQEDLPKASNIYYPGMKTYDELPSYLARFDVALVPFALNESTRYLSPTKTLEYMAAHKPIVSNPIHDVVELYGEVVHIANNPQEFVQQVELALAENPANRRAKEDELLQHYTWDSIASRMNEIIRSSIETKGNSNSKQAALSNQNL